MHLSRTIRLGLALTGLCALAITAARPARAQAFQYTLGGVTFADGATATGSFSYDFTTKTFGAFDVTTTNGLTDGLLGTHYLPPTATATALSNFAFEFFSGSDELVLNTFGPDNALGILPLQPGTSSAPNSLTASGEFARFATGATAARVISAGSLVSAPPVPEASTTVSLGLLLALGLGGVVIAAKRKKAQSAL